MSKKRNSYTINAERLSVGEALEEAKNKVIDLAGDPKATKDDVKKAQDHADELETKFNLLDKAYNDAKNEEIKALTPAKKPKASVEMTKDEKKNRVEAAWIRSIMKPQDTAAQAKWHEVKDALTDDDKTQGGDLLPINVSSDLIYEPFVTNPLREMETVTTITNLVLPKIAFSVDTGAIADGTNAKDATLTGGEIEFGRFKTKVRAGISETILNGSDAQLTAYINNALSSALQERERDAALTTSPVTGEEHMSFYSAENNIASVQGETQFKAIKKAIADLDDRYQDSAQVLMTRTDYYDMLDELANNSAVLYTRQPEEVLGVPVHFTSKATTPIVGDFKQAQLNYNIDSPIFESYKDFQTGYNYFVLTAWLDHRIKLSSAFRLAKVASK